MSKQLDINGLIADEIFQNFESLVKGTNLYNLLNKKGNEKFDLLSVKLELHRMLSKDLNK